MGRTWLAALAGAADASRTSPTPPSTLMYPLCAPHMHPLCTLMHPHAPHVHTCTRPPHPPTSGSQAGGVASSPRPLHPHTWLAVSQPSHPHCQRPLTGISILPAYSHLLPHFPILPRRLPVHLLQLQVTRGAQGKDRTCEPTGMEGAAWCAGLGTGKGEGASEVEDRMQHTKRVPLTLSKFSLSALSVFFHN